MLPAIFRARDGTLLVNVDKLCVCRRRTGGKGGKNAYSKPGQWIWR